MCGRFGTPLTAAAFGEGQAELDSVHSPTARRRTGDEDGVVSYADSTMMQGSTQNTWDVDLRRPACRWQSLSLKR